jgi:ribonuclease-3
MSASGVRLASEVQAFCARLGHDFARPELLLRALTHSSCSTPGRPDNQRLEFLGDRVLGLVLADALLMQDVTAREGVLAPRLNALVRKETCAEIAREIGLGDVLRLGRSEMMSGGRRKETLLGDAMEAVIAAVYRDAGFPTARDLVLRLWAARLAGAMQDTRDAKTLLQEWAQARGLPLPVYDEISRDGPPHAPVFVIAVSLSTGASAQARAGAKRHAEQLAARALLDELEKDA